MYSLRTERLVESDLAFRARGEGVVSTDPAVARQFHDLMSLYQASNAILDQNRIRSWKEYGLRL